MTAPLRSNSGSNSGSDREMTLRAASPGPSPAVMPTYARQNIVFERGEGSWLIATDGARYLDFASGVAVNALGHCHPHLVAALQQQAGTLWHTSNLYRVAGQERLAERLVATTFADRVFFCNSGAEACEGAIKAARKYHSALDPDTKRWRIITFTGAFHGRTLATLSAAGNETYLKGFGHPADGFDHVKFGDHDALHAAITDETAAIMVEPLQGEGGVRLLPDQCLAGLRELCDRHGILLVLDEVQTGVGRTGKLFAHEWAGITPDIMAIAKGIGGGFPLGAFLATEKAAAGMTAGTHGSTFGGNPLATAVGNAVLDVVLEEGFLAEVQAKSQRLKQALARVHDAAPSVIEGVRGRGFLMGLKLRVPTADFVKAALAQNLLLVGAADQTVRVLPPLNASDEEISLACDRMVRAAQSLSNL